MDYSEKTIDELNTIIREANRAIEEYDTRVKQKVYGIFIPFIGWQYWIDKNLAVESLLSEIAVDIYSHDGIVQVGVKYYNLSELDYCQDIQESQSLITIK